MSNVLYTSDIHIGHKKVSEIRGFSTTEEHDAWLADLWDSTVCMRDTVYILGDISINGGQHALDWIAERPGAKILVAGNHDPVHPGMRTAVGKLAHWNQYFHAIVPFSRRRLEGMNFLLSHFPYLGTGAERPGEDEVRFEQYRLPDLGLPLLHGHTHIEERFHVSDAGTPQMHVGIDAWKSLVPEKTVLDWLRN